MWDLRILASLSKLNKMGTYQSLIVFEQGLANRSELAANLDANGHTAGLCRYLQHDLWSRTPTLLNLAIEGRTWEGGCTFPTPLPRS